ncbi:DEAD/DEAH box helicase [archaeon]|nr:MAG: DEAD/DEAH box helicase [archaeon]
MYMVVLDEADRMVDMGFDTQVTTILDAITARGKSTGEGEGSSPPSNPTPTPNSTINDETDVLERTRVTAMFTATMPPEVEGIAKKFLHQPVILRIGDEESGKNKRIEQRVCFMPEGSKKNKLIEDLSRLPPGGKAIVFVNLKKTCDQLSNYLEGGREGGSRFATGVLHGGRTQESREEVIELFRAGEVRVLIATDVAGRGLDIPEVSLVINFDLPPPPRGIQAYTHRIGRTGRAGRSGLAISYLTEADTDIMFDLKSYLEDTGADVPAQLSAHAAAQAPVGTRDEKGKLVGTKRDAVMYAK